MLKYQGNPEKFDFNMLNNFDEDEGESEKRAQRHRERAIANTNPNDTASRRGNWLFLTILAACALGLMFLHIYGGIELNQVRIEIAEAQLRISEANRDNGRLNAELESMATPARVEAFAAENGLVREQALQVTYIYVNVESVVEIAQEPELGFFETLSARINRFLESLGLARNIMDMTTS